MIDIYAFNLETDGKVISEKTLIQSIPMTEDPHLLNPNVKNGMESAGSFSFSLQPNDIYYDAVMQLRTLILVEYDGDFIFFGRVLTIDNQFWGERKYTCEGAISMLLDSSYPPEKESDRKERTLNEYLTLVIENHNHWMDRNGDNRKKVYLGEVPGHYSANIASEQQIPNVLGKFGNSSWTQTKSVLDDLKSYHGGCFRLRYVNDMLYLDWLDLYFNNILNGQTIEIGVNLISANEVTEVDNIFTVVIPIGKASNNDLYITGYRPEVHGNDKYISVSDLLKIYTEEELNTGYHTADDYRYANERYGTIVKIVTFDDQSTQEGLFNAACEWIKNNYHGRVESISVKALDLHQLGYDIQKILVGDRLHIRFPYGKGPVAEIVDRYVTCTDADYDLYNPENNSYTLGIPSMALTKNYRSKGSSVNKDSTYTPKSPDLQEPELDTYDGWVRSVFSWLQTNQVWYKSNGNKPGGPNSRRQDNYFLYPTIDIGEDGHAIYKIWRPSILQVIQGIPIWEKDANGHPKGQWKAYELSKLTMKVIQAGHFFKYIEDEYGVNMKTGLSVKMPAVTPNDSGGINITSGIFDSSITDIIDVPEGGLVDKALSFVKDTLGVDISDGGIFTFFSTGNNDDGSPTILAKIFGGENGDLQLFQVDENGNQILDDQGNPIVLSLTNLKIKTYDNEKKVGWFVIDDPEGNPMINTESSFRGELSLGIEDYYKGKLVVARMAGDLVYIGTQDVDEQGTVITKNLTAASLNHIDTVAGDVDYEVDPSTGVKYLKINSGGGMRTRHGVIDPVTGEFKRDDHGEIIYSEFGVFDQNTLTGGMVVQKLADGSVVTDISGDIINLKTNDDFNQLTLDANGLKHEMYDADGKVGKQGGKISTLENSVDGLTSSVGIIDGQISTLSNTVDGLSHTVGTQGGQISTLTNTVDGLNHTVGTQGSQISKLSNTVDGLTSTVGTQGGQISTLTNTVDGLNHTVGTQGGQISTLTNSVNGFTAKLENVVDANGNVTAASIATAINDQGQAGVKIKGKWVDIVASQVKVGSTSTVEAWMGTTDIWKNSTDETLDTYQGLIADRATIGQLNAATARISTIESNYITANDITADKIASKISSINRLLTKSVDCGGDFRMVGDQANQFTATFGNYVHTYITLPNTYDVDGHVVDMRRSFCDVEKTQSGNNITLTFSSLNGAEEYKKTVTFSRATTLSGAWSGGRFTVNASPQGNSYYSDIYMIRYADPTLHDTIPNVINVPTKVMAYLNGSTESIETGKEQNITANISGFLQDRTGDNKITSNGTYSPGAGYVGFSGVEVDVSQSVSVVGQGFVEQTSQLPSGERHDPLNNLKSQIVNNRNNRGYIYFRLKVGDTYHVYYFADNGNGWTS